VLELPLADEGLAADFDLLPRRRIDHVAVVGSDLLVQALRRVRQKVPVLVDRAALDRHAVPDGRDGLVEPRRAVDDEELGPSQAALEEIVEHGAPSLGAPAHALDCEQHLLAVLAYAQDHKERDGSCFAVEPHAHHCAVENEPHDLFFGKQAGVPRLPVAILPSNPSPGSNAVTSTNKSAGSLRY